MPLDPSISLQVQTPNPMNTLGSLANTANAIQSFQSGNIALQQQRQANQERQAVIQLMQSDPTMKPQDDGTFDLGPQNMQKLQQAAPQTWMDWAQKAADTNTKMTAAKQSILGLGKDNATLVGQTVQSLAGASADQRADSLGSLVKQFPGTKPFIDSYTESLKKINAAPNLSDQQKQQATEKMDGFWTRFTQNIQEQQAEGTPSTVSVPTEDSSGGITNNLVNMKPGIPSMPVGKAVISAPALVSPAEQQTSGFDSRGNPIVVSKSPRGAITSVSGAPVAGQPSVPPQVLPQNETQASQQDMIGRRQAISDAAAQVPDQHYNNQQIKSILNKGGIFNTTGSNAGVIAKLGSAIGVPLGEDSASNINTIGHFLALQTQANEKAMGVNTDAGRSVSGAASGSVQQDPKSLKTTVNINDATSSALDYYNRGKEAAIKSGGIFAQRDFQNQWTQIYGRYGPYAMRLLNAGATGDKEEAANVVSELGGKKSLRFQQMLMDAQKLDKLAMQGHL